MSVVTLRIPKQANSLSLEPPPQESSSSEDEESQRVGGKRGRGVSLYHTPGIPEDMVIELIEARLSALKSDIEKDVS
jgi:hypothetical protein